MQDAQSVRPSVPVGFEEHDLVCGSCERGFFRDFLVISIWLKMNMLRAKTWEKPGKIGGVLRSTAGGRELGLKARPPARLIRGRTPFPIEKFGLLPVV